MIIAGQARKSATDAILQGERDLALTVCLMIIDTGVIPLPDKTLLGKYQPFSTCRLKCSGVRRTLKSILSTVIRTGSTLSK